MTLTICPCNPKKHYSDCCYPFHVGISLPVTAEQLMRSRYSAYVLKLTDYINLTWHASTRPAPATIIIDDSPVKWISLTIMQAWSEEQSNEAFVEFVARYKVNGKAEKMHETSRFVYEDNRWFYIDGNFLAR